ncbi:MAG: DUF4922 domain-containing protein [Ignavibacteriaceae bacterium]|nr:DUF4922 domain-containing protein [Ignavibacteriaceae bacterium]
MSSKLSLLQEFFTRQTAEWLLAGDNFAALKNCLVKEFSVRGNTIKVQYNPGRIVSTAAKVDTKSISERKCFLCRENRPNEQHDLPFDSEYVVLINPFPIFPEHFTIPKTAHVDQKINGEVSALVDMTVEFGDAYSIFYNGPRCGASAPDHHHFQMGTAGFMPMEKDVTERLASSDAVRGDGYFIDAVYDGLRSYIRFVITDTASKELVVNEVESFISFYKKFSGGSAEPMMNIVSCKDRKTGDIYVLILLRSKHRPDVYFADEPERLVISPASVDVGGKIITPRKEDFDRINEELIASVFDEVFVSKERLKEVFSAFVIRTVS